MKGWNQFNWIRKKLEEEGEGEFKSCFQACMRRDKKKKRL